MNLSKNEEKTLLKICEIYLRLLMEWSKLVWIEQALKYFVKT